MYRRIVCPTENMTIKTKNKLNIIALLGSWKSICLTVEVLRCSYQWCHSPPVKPRCLQVTSRSAWVQFLELVHTDLHLPFTST